MIGLDTDVLVRYLALDDARQSASATRFIASFKTGSRRKPVSRTC